MEALSSLIRPGEYVRTEPSGMTWQVEELLGRGAQGEVSRISRDNSVLALKWYLPGLATPARRAALEQLVESGEPDTRFLWPLEIASCAKITGFGYTMRLREPRYRGLEQLMTRKINPSFRALTLAGLQLADSFLQLHAKGLCYRDISFGNIFLDPDNGDVLICDNDNVTENLGPIGDVLGTHRFMAPEVVRNEALPSTQTDLYSLAVLLFYMFMTSHPLEGRRELAYHCLDAPAMTRLFGHEPLFIFDPVDRSNEPVAGEHDNALASWPIYPRFLHRLFTRAFTVGIRDPQHGRVLESEWRDAMARLRDAIVYCSSCEAENFYDAETQEVAGERAGQCWSCRKRVRLPMRLCINDYTIVLNHDSELYNFHVQGGPVYDFSKPVATVARHPSQPGVWGLKNLSSTNWISITNDTTKEIPPGRSETLRVGTRIFFGRAEGEVRM